jgi:hypothetical protein
VVDQHPDRDRGSASSGNQFREVPADRCVETDPTALDQLQDRGGGEGLGDAADAVPQVGGDRATGDDIGDPGGTSPDLVAVAHLGEQARHPGAVDVVKGGVQLRGVQWIAHDMRPFAVRGMCSTFMSPLCTRCVQHQVHKLG